MRRLGRQNLWHYLSAGALTFAATGNLASAQAVDVATPAAGRTRGGAPLPPLGAKDEQPVHGEAPAVLEEIVVTAQKRVELAQDVPLTVNEISGATLEKLNATSLLDFAGYLPGLSINPGANPGTNQLILRGLDFPDSGTPLVATYIDDTPTSASHGNPFIVGAGAIEVFPYDLDRVDVVSGPQGTLYGANSMGGAVKYVTRSPDLDHFSGRVGIDGTTVASAGNRGDLRGSANIPIVH